MRLADFDTDYVVEVHSPFLQEPHLRGFDDRASAEAFMDECRDSGLQIGALRLHPRSIGNLTLHGREGITVRPEPAIAMPEGQS